MVEVMARGGVVILISDRTGVELTGAEVAASIVMPDCHWLTAPIVYATAVQLLAYHAALDRGTDLDRPRNLAESATVE